MEIKRRGAWLARHAPRLHLGRTSVMAATPAPAASPDAADGEERDSSDDHPHCDVVHNAPPFCFVERAHPSRRRTLCTFPFSVSVGDTTKIKFRFHHVTLSAYGKIPGMKSAHKPTSFQMKVYKATSRIPHGKVATYGWVARQIGCRSAQAVGGALRVNPFAPKVPCHRVIASDGSLHGFAGHTSGPLLAKKRRLLQEEGIAFDALGRVIKDQILQ